MKCDGNTKYLYVHTEMKLLNLHFYITHLILHLISLSSLTLKHKTYHIVDDEQWQ